MIPSRFEIRPRLMGRNPVSGLLAACAGPSPGPSCEHAARLHRRLMRKTARRTETSCRTKREAANPFAVNIDPKTPLKDLLPRRSGEHQGPRRPGWCRTVAGRAARGPRKKPEQIAKKNQAKARGRKTSDLPCRTRRSSNCKEAHAKDGAVHGEDQPRQQARHRPVHPAACANNRDGPGRLGRFTPGRWRAGRTSNAPREFASGVARSAGRCPRESRPEGGRRRNPG